MKNELVLKRSKARIWFEVDGQPLDNAKVSAVLTGTDVFHRPLLFAPSGQSVTFNRSSRQEIIKFDDDLNFNTDSLEVISSKLNARIEKVVAAFSSEAESLAFGVYTQEKLARFLSLTA